ncbi:MAG: Asp23/Gls24 family envelope stress response protein [Pseudonocardiaceae bacterium]
MTGATTHPQPAAGATPATPARHGAVDPDERGQLRISPLVLRKIAEHTVDLTPGTLPARRTVAGVGLGSTGASAKAIITGQTVDVRVELALRYPGPVRSTVDQLRSRIGDEVRRITGYQVGSIAVTVTALLPEPSPGLR